MTLLGCVPVERLQETGSNVKSAVESRTERENLKRKLDVPENRYDGEGAAPAAADRNVDTVGWVVRDQI